MKAALIVVDVQNDFKKGAGAYACPELDEDLLSRIESLVDFCRSNGIPVIFTRHTIMPNKSNAELGEPNEVRACIKLTDGWHVAEEVGSKEDDWFVNKDRFDAFYMSGLESITDHLDIDTVIICGVWTNNCVRATAEGAYYRNYRLVLISDCCGAVDFVDKKNHRGVSIYTLEELKERTYLTKLLTLERFKEQFNELSRA
jgi:ureidoacrylate peracid hydrolase